MLILRLLKKQLFYSVNVSHTHVLDLFANLYSLTCSLITESVIQSLASLLGEYSSYCVFIKFEITHVFAHTFPLIVSGSMFNSC